MEPLTKDYLGVCLASAKKQIAKKHRVQILSWELTGTSENSILKIAYMVGDNPVTLYYEGMI